MVRSIVTVSRMAVLPAISIARVVTKNKYHVYPMRERPPDKLVMGQPGIHELPFEGSYIISPFAMDLTRAAARSSYTVDEIERRGRRGVVPEALTWRQY